MARYGDRDMFKGSDNYRIISTPQDEREKGNGRREREREIERERQGERERDKAVVQPVRAVG
jgi:hypothetical protein